MRSVERFSRTAAIICITPNAGAAGEAMFAGTHTHIPALPPGRPAAHAAIWVSGSFFSADVNQPGWNALVIFEITSKLPAIKHDQHSGTRAHPRNGISHTRPTKLPIYALATFPWSARAIKGNKHKRVRAWKNAKRFEFVSSHRSYWNATTRFLFDGHDFS